ncbi:MAG TPA: ABC transporter ATP-binding protein [Chitinophagaceae bacterium]|nr:ABC transporter ATP-binding protein [Chitinophagaceae bacterium]
MIQIQHVNKQFKKLKALDDICTDFRKGQVISLIGPNGSGKTTLIKSILGMVRPDSGRILVNDTPIETDPSYRHDIGYMPQIGRYPDNLSIGHLFSMMKNIRDAKEDQLDTDLITEFKLTAQFDKSMRTLSGGTRQKVSAALAFYFNPSILILDEPTAGLDPVSSEILKHKILAEKARNKLILITSHILSDLDELTTDILYLQDGKQIFFKSIEKLRQETGQAKLGKAVAGIMKEREENNLWVDKESGLIFKRPNF